jgi:hypothetical protein
MVKELSLSDLTNFYCMLNKCLWFEDCLHLIGPNMAKARAAELFKRGMQTVRDVWDTEAGCLKEWDEVAERFQLTQEDRPFWRQLTDSFPRDWSCKLRIGPLHLKKREWLGIF